MDRPNRIPLSLSDLKRKRNEDNLKAAKPVFQNKAARQAAALERLQKRRAEQKERTNLQITSQKRPRPVSPTDAHEREQIRNNYTRPRYVSARRRHDGKRFRFSWDVSDDTAQDASAITAVAPRPQFGRGNLGGLSNVQPATAAQRDARHWSEKSAREMTMRDWRIFREDNIISLRSSTAAPPNPARNWAETALPNSLLHLVTDVARYQHPSPIQMTAIPVALAQRDCIGLAETGSGKTAAFVLPMLVHISNMPPMTPAIASRGPYALILAPTRELALQIEAEANKFAEPLGYRVVHIIGGQQLDVQAMLLQAGCEIVVCTPGRMVDLLSKQMAALGNCNYLILDEADRMIDMGFEPQLAEVLECMPVHQSNKERRRTFMFSATMSPAVERLAKTYLSDPVIISIGETGKAADNVEQKVQYFTTENRRRERFLQLIETLRAPILVFVNTRSGCEMVSRYVESNSSVRPAIMHSGKSQEVREKTLEGFRTGRCKILIATDVVGRGIDIKGVRHVINFELPKTVEAYTHRIGRTGRAGEKGTAWSLATEADSDIFQPLCQILQKSGAHIPPEIARGSNRKGGAGLLPIIE